MTKQHRTLSFSKDGINQVTFAYFDFKYPRIAGLELHSTLDRSAHAILTT